MNRAIKIYLVMVLMLISTILTLANDKKLDQYISGNNFNYVTVEPKLHELITREDISIHQLVDSYFMGKGLLEQINQAQGTNVKALDIRYLEGIFNKYFTKELELKLIDRESYLMQIKMMNADDQYSIKEKVVKSNTVDYILKFNRHDPYTGEPRKEYIEFTITYNKKNGDFIWDYENFRSFYVSNDKLLDSPEETLKYMDLFSVLMYDVSTGN